MKSNKYTETIVFLLIFIISYFAFFWQMEARGLLTFDEARQAVSALEMSHSGNIWVTTFEGKPEMWNTKPPLLIWLMAASIKLFGNHVWALRLPVALAAFTLCLVLFGWLLKRTGNLAVAFLSVLLLITAPGFIGEHAARTADYDVVLVLFIALYCLSFFDYIQNGNPYKLLYAGLFFTLAFLTKSIAACFAIPGLIIYGLYSNKLVSALTKWQLYAGLAFCILAAGGYYYIREGYNPGYIQAVSSNEWGGRFNNVQENSSGPWYYYFTRLGDWRQFSPGFYFLLPFTIASLYAKGLLRKLALFSVILWGTVLIVISAAASKLPHYALPMYPFMVITSAIGLYVLYMALKQRVGNLACVLFAIPLYFAVSGGFYVRYFVTAHNDNTVEYGHLFSRLKPAKIKALDVNYNPGLYYYMQTYNQRGFLITNVANSGEISLGDTVVTCNDLQNTFSYTKIDSIGQCKALVINGVK